MKKIALIGMAVVFLLVGDADAAIRRRWRSSGSSSHYNPAYAEEVKTAQGVANIMARLGRVGHFGGNKSYEGCGSGRTKEAAFMNCCYSRSGMKTVDVGYAQSASGMWYCCRRYVR